MHFLLYWSFQITANNRCYNSNGCITPSHFKVTIKLLPTPSLIWVLFLLFLTGSQHRAELLPVIRGQSFPWSTRVKPEKQGLRETNAYFWLFLFLFKTKLWLAYWMLTSRTRPPVLVSWRRKPGACRPSWAVSLKELPPFHGSCLNKDQPVKDACCSHLPMCRGCFFLMITAGWRKAKGDPG